MLLTIYFLGINYFDFSHIYLIRFYLLFTSCNDNQSMSMFVCVCVCVCVCE